MEKWADQAARGRSWPIDHVADDRVADSGEVDADLVGPAGFKFQPEQRVIAKALQYPKRRSRLAATRDDAHLLPVAPIASNRRFDPAARRLYEPVDERQVLFLDPMLTHLLDQILVREIGKRDDH